MDEARIRQRLAAARRIVVKAGTNVIMRDDGAVALGRLYGLIESVASLKKQGRHVLIVSSGAVGSGRSGCAWKGSRARSPSSRPAPRSGRAA